MFKNLLKPVKWLVVLLIVILVSSFAASLVQTSFFSVKVEAIKFETDNGELAGYLYTPRGVDETNPAPAVIFTHGYLNNKEMQEIGAIELSKRGYVVLTIDMYDHGDSSKMAAAFSFYAKSLYDAAQYMYDQDFVLKDGAGNGMIGVSGHSMGGFSAAYALVFDEMDFATNGYRKITTALPVGSDFRYVFVADPTTYFANRSVGIVAAHYDQFFFDNDSPAGTGSVIYKDFVTDSQGLLFLGRTDVSKAGVFYSLDGGQRVIYTPNETHPQNTWSLETGANTIEFFEEAFTFQLDLHGLGTLESYDIRTGDTNQSWWLKEAFTLVSLVALFALIFPVFTLVTTLPVFKKANVKDLTPIGEIAPMPTEKKYLKFGVVSIASLLSAFYIPTFMNRTVAELAQVGEALYYIMGGAAVVAIAVWIAALIKNDPKLNKVALKVSGGSLLVVFVALAFRWLLTHTTIVSDINYYGASSVNTIWYWALCSAALILLVTFITAPVLNHGEEVENPYGVKATPVQIGASFLTAAVVTTGILLVVAVIGWIFLTDFRIYTYAIQIFNGPQFVAALRYMPIIFVYYFAAAISVHVNTRNMKGWLADLFAAFLLAGPIVLFLVYNYYVLYNTGAAAFPSFSLSAILCVGLIPTLSVAGIISRRFSQKTGNIWTSVFFNTMFFTLITLANTIVYVIAIV
ncbi:MAG: alpha/beta hydrolase [Acholeplasmataceae bacterium]|nr:alpha/beta hydrolase [Acholeplasmataceae bacterium]